MNGEEQLNATEVDGVIVVRFTVRRILDLQQIKETLDTLILDREKPALVLNLATLAFCGSAFMGNILRLNEKLKAADGKLVLCNVGSEMREVFRIVGIHKLLDVMGNEAEAVERLRTRAT